MTPIMTFLPGGLDACALYRMYIPHMKIRNSRFLFNDGNLPLAELVDSDLLLVQRLVSDINYKALLKFEDMGLKVAYDLDDNLWEVPNYNPASKLLRQVESGFGTCASKCAVVVVSTEHLRASVKKHIGKQLKGKEIVTVPNAIDFNLFQPLAKKESELVNVGWFGTNTHSGDVAEVFSLLPDLLKANTNIRFLFVGLPAPEEMRGHKRVKQINFVPVAEYPSRLASWRCDIMLAPLQNNPFNRSKSNIKMLEAAALRTPILVSPVGPYLDFCKWDRELNYLICNTKQQWRTKIVELVNDSTRREYIGNRMYEVASQNYNVESTKYDWMELANV